MDKPQNLSEQLKESKAILNVTMLPSRDGFIEGKPMVA
jgi:preprotein translocase subunit Sss1